MNMVTSRQLPARPLAVPNLLTYARIAAVPAVVACLYWQDILEGGLWLRWVALVIFIGAAVTDVLDGYFARKWGEQSVLGRMLDPIADKLLVASCLLMLAADGTIRGWSLWAAIVILCREILVSGLREYLAELRVSVPVTQLAKWKTTLQLVAVGFLIAGIAGDAVLPGGDPGRADPALAVGSAHAVHGLGLFPGRGAPSDQGLGSGSLAPPAGLLAARCAIMHYMLAMMVNGCGQPGSSGRTNSSGRIYEGPLLRLGARAYRQARGGDRAARGDHDRRRSHGMVEQARRGIRLCVREPKVVRAAIDHAHVKPEANIAGAREVALFPPMTGG